jgi:release factor glutamine methyltransferase
MTIQELIDEASAQLRDITPSAQREACLLLAHILQKTYEEIYFNTEVTLTEAQVNLFQTLVNRRLKHEPLSKIRQSREFWSLPFRVTADTLDPRPDSETLIESVLAYYKDRSETLRILDLGTGTGCLLLSLLSEYPTATGTGIDISEDACRIAQENAQNLNLINRSAFIVGNWVQAIQGQFDIIISNPPYIALDEPLPAAVKDYDPALSLYGGNDGFEAYRVLAREVNRISHPNTKLFLEVGDTQAEKVISIFFNYLHINTHQDLAGKNRILVFCINAMPVDMA